MGCVHSTSGEEFNQGTPFICLIIPNPQQWVGVTKLWSWMSCTCHNGSSTKFYNGLRLLFLQHRQRTPICISPARKLDFSVPGFSKYQKWWEKLRAHSTPRCLRDTSERATYIILPCELALGGTFSMEMSSKACCVLEQLVSTELGCMENILWNLGASLACFSEPTPSSISFSILHEYLVLT